MYNAECIMQNTLRYSSLYIHHSKYSSFPKYKLKQNMRQFLLFPIAIFCLFLQKIDGQPDISKKKFHLYLLAGQSNMAGRGTVEQQDTIRHHRIWVLNKKNEWELAKEPLHFDKPQMVGVGLGFAFAKEMAKIDTNIVIGLIPCAVGGSSISVWETGKYHDATKSYPYDDAIRRTKVTMQHGILKGILWQQGESDCDSLKAMVYATQLELLVKCFRKNLKIKKLPFVAGKIPDFYIKL